MEQVVQDLIERCHKPENSVVTILGMTFKENVPDLRNTRVIDIVKGLDEQGIAVQIHDPIAKADEARNEYGVKLSSLEQLADAQSIVFAVPHQQYIDMGWQLFRESLKDGTGTVFDIKAKLGRESAPHGIKLWRL